MSSNKKREELNTEVASQILNNVFDACNVAPNSIPLEELESYKDYREDKFKSKKLILVVILLIFIAVPLLFIAPTVNLIDLEGTESFPKYHLNVDSLLPVTSVTATIDKKKVEVIEVEPKVYSIEPDMAGTMIVTVKSINGQYTTCQIDVVETDKLAPTVVKDEFRDGRIRIYLKDDSAGVDYKKIYAMDINGETIRPAESNAGKNYVAFDYPKTSINIFIPDKAGNTLHLAITIK